MVTNVVADVVTGVVADRLELRCLFGEGHCYWWHSPTRGSTSGAGLPCIEPNSHYLLYVPRVTTRKQRKGAKRLLEEACRWMGGGTILISTRPKKLKMHMGIPNKMVKRIR